MNEKRCTFCYMSNCPHFDCSEPLDSSCKKNEDILEQEAWEGEQYQNNDYHKHKFDQGKTRWDLIPVECYEELFRVESSSFWNIVYMQIISEHEITLNKSLYGVRTVLEHGAEKYGEESWKTIPNAKQRYFGAYMRHMFDDETNDLPIGHVDKDSGMLSVYHALANVIFLLWFYLNDK